MPTDVSRACFVIAPIGPDDSDTRRRSDLVLRHIITPAAKECGYEAIRADQISEPGLITTQVIQYILEAPLVVADLTDRNPNVYYELAIRHAVHRPYVQIIKKGEPIPLDVANVRTIPVDHTDLDSAATARDEIAKQIRAMQVPGMQVDSPVTTAMDVSTLRRSDDPERRQLADLLTTVSEMRVAFTAIDQKLEYLARRTAWSEFPQEDMDYLRHSLIRVYELLKPSDAGLTPELVSEVRAMTRRAMEAFEPIRGRSRLYRQHSVLGDSTEARLRRKLLDEELKQREALAERKEPASSSESNQIRSKSGHE